MPEIRYQDHTDGVQEKLDLLRAAYSASNYDLALSLSDSIKDTILFERQLQVEPVAATVEPESFRAVSDLPAAWAKWADGWTFYKPLQLIETIGIARSREPVEAIVNFRIDQTTDLRREVRVVSCDVSDSTLREIPCQILHESRHGQKRHCRLLFFADVPAHGQSAYVVFYGNPFAELPEYATDLSTSGEGYGLDIANEHYVARLSRQMGQLERLTYKREHGLELFAGGKGHGEPPCIDWAHDYVDQGGFQKLRMRNWPRCPNYEVVKGPLCVRVRRWGFPYSPVHPLFTPSRIHMDQTYVFYAGLPYFVKEGRIDAVQDVWIEAMRDDEWVFSGYSFNETVWIDRAGKLHEGTVPPAHADDLWGVGYFNRQSRDAFIALWLMHAAEKFDSLGHNGLPMLHYAGHGHVWSRYPAAQTQLHAGASIRQKNAYLVIPYPQQGAAALIESVRDQLLNPVQLRAGELAAVSGVKASGTLARPGETAESAPLKPTIWDALREVRDEQLYTVDANIVDMGYVYDVRVRDGVVRVLVTMPHRGRPVYEFLATQGGGRVAEGIRERLLKLQGVRDVLIDFSWDPPWSVARLTDAGRQAMGLPG